MLVYNTQQRIAIHGMISYVVYPATCRHDEMAQTKETPMTARFIKPPVLRLFQLIRLRNAFCTRHFSEVDPPFNYRIYKYKFTDLHGENQ